MLLISSILHCSFPPEARLSDVIPPIFGDGGRQIPCGLHYVRGFPSLPAASGAPPQTCGSLFASKQDVFPVTFERFETVEGKDTMLP